MRRAGFFYLQRRPLTTFFAEKVVRGRASEMPPAGEHFRADPPERTPPE